MTYLTNELIDLFEKTNSWITILNSNKFDKLTKGWEGLKEVQLAHISILNNKIQENYIPKVKKYDRGIVIGAGGAKYFGCAFACVFILRKMGCELPIEFWYLDEYEMDNTMKQLCDIHNITYINANQYCLNNQLNPRILNGWELKPFSTLHSNFNEVLYLDADNIPFKDPTYLFDLSDYKQLGSIFWPDLAPNKRKEWLPPICWENIGLQYRDEVDFETGQYLINTTKCFKELNITMWMNEHSDWFYKFVFGDKSTFHLAWRKCGSEYVIPKKNAGWKHPCILQYDLSDQLLFQHACQGKELIFNGIGPTNHYNHHLVKAAYDIRIKHWSGSIYSWNEMNNEELKYAEQHLGKYHYERIGLDSRTLELKDKGIIGEGYAKCERRWSIRIIDNIPTIVIIGAAHKDSEIAMFFAKDSGDGERFLGQWTAFEKCNVVLEKIS